MVYYVAAIAGLGVLRFAYSFYREEDEASTAKLVRKTTQQRSKYYVPPKRPTFSNNMKTLYHITDAGKAIKKTGEIRQGSGGPAKYGAVRTLGSTSAGDNSEILVDVMLH
eukprot:TRINITY_DN21532_c0_g1_i2.p1 TRINITY_DN21532_c0_g1~~TRINITY_DN21532_c0_g1_i2.p1  ORF type:complete len:110 (+),score=25.47 TRINITY_DN21532_c0_g1_i2:295-624(+)